MKSTLSLLLGLGTLGAIPVLSAQDVKLNVPGVTQTASAAPAASSGSAAGSTAAPAATHTEDQILQVIGWAMGQNEQVDTFGLDSTQLDSVMKGFRVAAAGEDSPVDINAISPEVTKFVQDRQNAYMTKLNTENQAAAAKFFTTLKSNPAVKFTSSGLGYEILKAGTGPYPKETDTVTVNYRGTMLDGTLFDSTFPEDQPKDSTDAAKPVDITLSNVLSGWKEGIQLINKGGRIRLYIPADLAYGEQGRQGIPPGAALIFEIELIDFKTNAGPASIAPGSTTGTTSGATTN